MLFMSRKLLRDIDNMKHQRLQRSIVRPEEASSIADPNPTMIRLPRDATPCMHLLAPMSAAPIVANSGVGWYALPPEGAGSFLASQPLGVLAMNVESVAENLLQPARLAFVIQNAWPSSGSVCPSTPPRKSQI